ncbi:MAG: SbcC/MukB-like Walker B domain-containing protein, partial [Endozoicomonas sp.]
QTVRFAEGVETLLQQENRILLEVGPGQTLSTFARQHPAKQKEQTRYQKALINKKKSLLNERTEELLEAEQQHRNDIYPHYLALNSLSHQFTKLLDEKKYTEQEYSSLQLSLLKKNQHIEALRTQYRETQIHSKDLEALLKQEQQISDLSDYRHKLQSGDACPLCGSKEHPAIEQYQRLNISDTEKRLNKKLVELESLKTLGETSAKEATRLQTQLEHTELSLINLQKKFATIQSDWQQSITFVDIKLSVEDFEAFQLQYADFQKSRDDLKALTRKLSQYNQQILHQQQQLDKTTQEITSMAHQRELALEQVTQLQARLTEKKQRHQRQSDAMRMLEEKLVNMLHSELDEQLPTQTEQWIWFSLQEQYWQQWQSALTEQGTLGDEYQKLEQQLALKNQESLKSEEWINEQSINADRILSEILQKKQLRHNLFGERIVQDEQQRLRQLINTADENFKSIQQQHEIAQQALNQLSGSIQQQNFELNDLSNSISNAEINWKQKLEISPFSDNETFLQAFMNKDERNALSELKQQLEQRLHESRGQLSAAESNLKMHQVINKTDMSLDKVTEKLLELDNRVRLINQRQGEISQALKDDETKRQHQSELLKSIILQENVFQLWAQLSGLIGSSKGDKFRKFAQGLTLEHLISLANRQLEQLHARYLLNRKSTDELNIEVLDTWQGDTTRDIKTLSGGESFLVSLALALGLSDLVSHKTRIDSLFLDEGFGTLDQETLETALTALDSLNASGKMVGVISHIESLKERIPTRIEVRKEAGLGHSKLDNHFAIN